MPSAHATVPPLGFALPGRDPPSGGSFCTPTPAHPQLALTSKMFSPVSVALAAEPKQPRQSRWDVPPARPSKWDVKPDGTVDQRPPVHLAPTQPTPAGPALMAPPLETPLPSLPAQAPVNKPNLALPPRPTFRPLASNPSAYAPTLSSDHVQKTLPKPEIISPPPSIPRDYKATIIGPAAAASHPSDALDACYELIVDDCSGMDLDWSQVQVEAVPPSDDEECWADYDSIMQDLMSPSIPGGPYATCETILKPKKVRGGKRRRLPMWKRLAIKKLKKLGTYIPPEKPAPTHDPPKPDFMSLSYFPHVPSFVVPRLPFYVIEQIILTRLRLTDKKFTTAARVALAFKTLPCMLPGQAELIMARMEPTYMLRRAIKAHVVHEKKVKEQEAKERDEAETAKNQAKMDKEEGKANKKPNPKDPKHDPAKTEQKKPKPRGFMPVLEAIKKYADPNKLDTTKHHPLNLASILGNVDLLKWWFVRYPNRRTGYKGTKALDCASERGYVDVLEWWRRSGLRVRSSNKAIDLASKNGHLGVMRWWYKHYKHRFNCSSLAVDLASRNNHIHILNWYIHETQRGFFFRYSARPVVWACLNAHIRILDWWLELAKRGEKNRSFKYSVRAMDVASKHGKVAVLDWFLKSGLPLRFSPALVLKAMRANDEVKEWWEASGLLLPEFMGEGPVADSKITDVDLKVTIIPSSAWADVYNGYPEDPTKAVKGKVKKVPKAAATAANIKPASVKTDRRPLFRYKRDQSTRVFGPMPVVNADHEIIKDADGKESFVYIELLHPRYEKRERVPRRLMITRDVWTPGQFLLHMQTKDLIHEAECELDRMHAFVADNFYDSAVLAKQAEGVVPPDGKVLLPGYQLFTDPDGSNPQVIPGSAYSLAWDANAFKPEWKMPTTVYGVRGPKQVANVKLVYHINVIAPGRVMAPMFPPGTIAPENANVEHKVRTKVSLPYLYLVDPVRECEFVQARLRKQVAKAAPPVFDYLMAMNPNIKFAMPVLEGKDYFKMFLIKPSRPKPAPAGGGGPAASAAAAAPTVPAGRVIQPIGHRGNSKAMERHKKALDEGRRMFASIIHNKDYDFNKNPAGLMAPRPAPDVFINQSTPVPWNGGMPVPHLNALQEYQKQLIQNPYCGIRLGPELPDHALFLNRRQAVNDFLRLGLSVAEARRLANAECARVASEAEESKVEYESRDPEQLDEHDEYGDETDDGGDAEMGVEGDVGEEGWHEDEEDEADAGEADDMDVDEEMGSGNEPNDYSDVEEPPLDEHDIVAQQDDHQMLQDELDADDDFDEGCDSDGEADEYDEDLDESATIGGHPTVTTRCNILDQMAYYRRR
ncbi:hypothetical protein BCR44DRAFT_89790 [Catenaria anguillulae PL171]|uniref:Uncharacterized protein n=1 Tax=Catenaria anguillulae PL171 TaxID=765915 RepID=A0A1Y2I554_9FUNG|nr:hypothetical protein BCR44DRAFT_89790 [Catenaria anguillulae PL171]